MNWKLPLATGIGGLLLGGASHFLYPPVEIIKTVTEVKWKERVVEKEVVKWKTRDVVKYKTRTIYKSDGTKIVESCKIGSKEKAGSEEKVSDKVAEKSEITTQEVSRPILSRYSVALHMRGVEVLKGSFMNPSAYSMSLGARLGALPLWMEGGVSGDLDFNLGLRMEF